MVLSFLQKSNQKARFEVLGDNNSIKKSFDECEKKEKHENTERRKAENRHRQVA
jgi:hypothetical protein